MKIKISKLGKRGKIVLVVLIATMFIGIASSQLIPYYGKITATMNVKQSIIVKDGSWKLENIIAGSSQMMLAKIINRAEVPVDVVAELRVYHKGSLVTDTAGFHIAWTDDVNSFYDGQGDMTGDGWEEWIYNNLDWCDWEVSDRCPIRDYYLDIIEFDDAGEGTPEDTGDVCYYSPMVDGVMPISHHTIPAEITRYAVVWVGTETGLDPGNYRVELTVLPTDQAPFIIIFSQTDQEEINTLMVTAASLYLDWADFVLKIDGITTDHEQTGDVRAGDKITIPTGVHSVIITYTPTNTLVGYWDFT